MHATETTSEMKLCLTPNVSEQCTIGKEPHWSEEILLYREWAHLSKVVTSKVDDESKQNLKGA